MFEQPARLGQYAILATMLFVATVAISFAVVLGCPHWLPSDYFWTSRAQVSGQPSRDILWHWRCSEKPAWRNTRPCGVILSVPGLPGQGLLTVLAGVFLLDFPGKRRLLYKILRQPPCFSRLIDCGRNSHDRHSSSAESPATQHAHERSTTCSMYCFRSTVPPARLAQPKSS